MRRGIRANASSRRPGICRAFRLLLSVIGQVAEAGGPRATGLIGPRFLPARTSAAVLLAASDIFRSRFSSYRLLFFLTLNGAPARVCDFSRRASASAFFEPASLPFGFAFARTFGVDGRAEALTSELLLGAGFSHAFFTRNGGVSPPPWASLNFAAATGDAPANVAENVRRAALSLGVAPERVYFLSQVHGIASALLDGSESFSEVVRREGDITFARERGVACGVRSADCVPILIGDRTSGAALAIHSGWRGTTLNVAKAGIVALREAISAKGDLVAAVGPHIEACCFEVGEDVAKELADSSSLGDRAILRDRPKPHVDLRAVVRAQLEAAGIASADIDDVRGCTVCEPERFHSFRRDGKVSGRLLSAIVSRGRALPAFG
jgi:YfiH family protein